MAISLSTIAALAKSYPARAAEFGRALAKLAESVKSYVDTEVAAVAADVTAITPSHVVKYAGEVTWSGSGASLAATVTGVDADDVVVASVHTIGTGTATFLESAVASADTITFTLDAASDNNDTVVSYVVLRAVV